MSKEKQIEEMAEIMSHSCEGECFTNKDGLTDCAVCEACLLYEAGYRKQSEGEWILTQEKRLFGDKYYTCSNCQSINPTMIKFNYCFNCGAKMKGEKQ
ncbi:MAG: hypothetical protein U0M60_01415 [Clostridia bacterium]|nr:hypothetical protein [Clostridia bacterium]